MIVKRTREHYRWGEALAKAYEQQIETGARLSHPNIVKTLEFGSFGDAHYVVTEEVDGVTLSELQRHSTTEGQALDPDVVVYLAIEICKAFEFSHGQWDSQGNPSPVLHRGLSPRNVFVTSRGGVKVADFGLAVPLDTGVVEPLTFDVSQITSFSPEQISGEGELDLRSDLFSFGSTLYELLSGRRPFEGVAREQLVRKVREAQTLPLELIAPTVPPALKDLVGRLLPRDREERPESAHQVRGWFEAYLRGVIQPVDPASLGMMVTEVIEAFDEPDEEPGLTEAPTRMGAVDEELLDSMREPENDIDGLLEMPTRHVLAALAEEPLEETLDEDSLRALVGTTAQRHEQTIPVIPATSRSPSRPPSVPRPRAVRVPCPPRDTFVTAIDQIDTTTSFNLHMYDPPEAGAPIDMVFALPNGEDAKISGEVVKVRASNRAEGMSRVTVEMTLSSTTASRVLELLGDVSVTPGVSNMVADTIEEGWNIERALAESQPTFDFFTDDAGVPTLAEKNPLDAMLSPIPLPPDHFDDSPIPTEVTPSTAEPPVATESTRSSSPDELRPSSPDELRPSSPDELRPSSPEPLSASSSGVRRLESQEPLTRLGRYEILAEIGVGGMATIYLSKLSGPAGFQKPVALKVIHRHLLKDTYFLGLFLDEARLASMLQHPNVVQIFDLGEHEGQFFIAMECLEGETVRQVYHRLRAGSEEAMDPRVACGIALQAAAGLHHAHELTDLEGKVLNLVHRDVSPHNIFVTYSGAVKLLDFGVAKARNQSEETPAGAIKGKFAYMSPEQVLEGSVDRRCDVFALGVNLWEMLAGRRLFEAKNPHATLQLVCYGEVPSLREVRPDIPPLLDAVVLKALSKEPEGRFSSALELHDALSGAAKELGGAATQQELASAMSAGFVEERKSWKAFLAAAMGGEAPSTPFRRSGSGRSEHGMARLRDDEVDVAGEEDRKDPTAMTMPGHPRASQKMQALKPESQEAPSDHQQEAASPSEVDQATKTQPRRVLPLLIVGAALLFLLATAIGAAIFFMTAGTDRGEEQHDPQRAVENGQGASVQPTKGTHGGTPPDSSAAGLAPPPPEPPTAVPVPIPQEALEPDAGAAEAAVDAGVADDGGFGGATAVGAMDASTVDGDVGQAAQDGSAEVPDMITVHLVTYPREVVVEVDGVEQEEAHEFQMLRARRRARVSVSAPGYRRKTIIVVPTRDRRRVIRLRRAR